MVFNREKIKNSVSKLASDGIFVGTSSWKYPGWRGMLYDDSCYVYRGKFAMSRFEKNCLTEYAEVFKTVCVDAAYYTFPSVKYLEGLAAQVPSDFQFAFKVTDAITIKQFPNQPRFGAKAGRQNETFLNAGLFERQFLKPCETIRPHIGILIFEFSRFHTSDFEHGRDFVAALDQFLGRLVAAIFTAIAAYAITAKIEPAKSKYIVRLKGFAWTREDFCRGWLITGDTGSGKTRSGINQLLFQVFQNDNKWGGLCIDDKGVYWETLVEMAAKFHRQNDLILLQVKPDNAPHGWKPRHTYNLLSDFSIPPSTYAKFVVDTVTSLGQRTEQSFFKNQAQTHIGLALELLSRMEMEVTLQNVRNFLLEDNSMNMVLKELKTDFPTARDLYLEEHFEHRYRGQPAEQMGGVKETIANYLQFFLTPDIAQVFCASENSFDFKDIDRGKIICVTMPQKYQMERRYINTFLKMLFYAHALRRFDRPNEERVGDNLIILWADEAQRFVTASEDGMSDYNCIDVMREAKATLVAAAQSSTSFIPPLGEEKAQVLTLNLRNRMIFKGADEAGAVESADFLGQRKIRQRTSGFSGGMITRSYTPVDEHKIKPYELRHLKKHQCVLVHCEKGFRKTLLPPLNADGKIPKWFPWWKRVFP